MLGHGNSFCKISQNLEKKGFYPSICLDFLTELLNAYISELQIRECNDDNSEIIFLIFPTKMYNVTPH